MKIVVFALSKKLTYNYFKYSELPQKYYFSTLYWLKKLDNHLWRQSKSAIAEL